jgi:hypothetical protein
LTQLTSTDVALISAGTFILSQLCSAVVAAFISGMHWGELRTDVREMNNRLAKIEGMFTLRLRDDD